MKNQFLVWKAETREVRRVFLRVLPYQLYPIMARLNDDFYFKDFFGKISSNLEISSENKQDVMKFKFDFDNSSVEWRYISKQFSRKSLKDEKFHLV